MAKKGKVIGALITAGIFGVGGVAGGIALANTQMEQKVADAEDKGYQEGHKDGYDEGLTVNVGYTEEDLENAKEEGREEGYQNGFEDGVNYVPEDKFLDISSLNLQGEIKSICNLSNGNKLIRLQGEDSNGLFLIDYQENIATELYSTTDGYDTYYELKNGNCLIATKSLASKILLFNASTKNISIACQTSGFWNEFLQLDNGDVLISGNMNGILKYKLEDNSVELINNDYRMWNKLIEINESTYLISSTLSNFGIVLYNSEDDSVNQIYESGNNWENYEVLNNGDCLISSSKTAGLLLYKQADKTISQIYSSGTNWKYFIPLADGNYLISTNSNSNGILCYESQLNTVSLIHNTGCYFQQYLNFDNDKYIISSDFSTTKGLFIFDSVEKTFNQICDFGYGFEFKDNLDGTIDCSYENFVYEYNVETEDLTLKAIKQ